MNTARLIAERSTCLRLQVGALVEIDGRILVTGYNGAPSGMTHCNDGNCGEDKPCTRTVHAEANCIAFAARNGIKLAGATLYTTDSPCKTCAELIINAGIKRVFFYRPYRDATPLKLMEESGLEAIAYVIA